MQALLDVVKVEAKPDYTLLLEFENGEKRVFDMAPYMDKKSFAQLKGPPFLSGLPSITELSSGQATSTLRPKRTTTGPGRFESETSIPF